MICPFMSTKNIKEHYEGFERYSYTDEGEKECLEKDCALWCVSGVCTGECAFKKIAINTEKPLERLRD